MKTMIEEMVTRFLGWKLPANFAPDAGMQIITLRVDLRV